MKDLRPIGRGIEDLSAVCLTVGLIKNLIPLMIVGAVCFVAGVLLDEFGQIKEARKDKEQMAEEEVQRRFVELVSDYCYEKKLFPLSDNFGNSLKIMHQDVKTGKVYDVIAPLVFPSTNSINSKAFKSALETAKETVDDFIETHKDLNLEDMNAKD